MPMADATDAAAIASGYALLRESAGAVELEREAVRVNGPDALTFLDGQLSQDIKAIPVGGHADSLLLQPQGKVVALVRVVRLAEDDFVLDTDAGFADAVIERLQRFKLRTKADIEREPQWRCVAIRGPRAHEVAEGLVADWPGLDGVDLVGADPQVPDGIERVPAAAYEAARIEAGVPVMGRELTEQTIPAEATGVVERSVSFTKGCYTGQELVARIDSRGGNVAKRLLGVELEGDDVPADGAPLHDADGNAVGVITSAAWSPRTGGVVALAYVGRKYEAPVVVARGVAKDLPLA
jgi:folate-binding protein YgfZ